METKRTAAGAGRPERTVQSLPQAPIRRRKVHEEVAERIEHMIREGDLQPGDFLPSEREFMAAFGVGRNAVREAMLSLQRMGLVAVSSGERSRVVRPTAEAMVAELAGAARLLLADDDGMRQFQDARSLFEGAIARRAARLATPADLARLEEILDRNRKAIGDHRAFMAIDVEFHMALADICRNPLFTAVHGAVVEWLIDQRAISGKAATAGEAAYAAHVRILEAIAAHDGAAAQLAMEDHLAAVAELYWQIRATNDTRGA